MHSDEFKADAVAACSQLGRSVAAVAMAQGINAKLLRRRAYESEMRPRSEVVRADVVDAVKAQVPETVFVPVGLPAPAPLAQPRTFAASSGLGPQWSR